MASGNDETTSDQTEPEEKDANAALDVSGVTKLPRSGLSELGVYGLKQSKGYVQEEFLPDLRGDRGAKFYREMSDNCATVNGLVLGYQQVASHLEWGVEEPEDASERDIAATEFIQECFEDMETSWDVILEQALSSIIYGWALHEIVYKRREDGRAGWARFPSRAQETLDHWDFGKHGVVEAMHQRDPETADVYKIPLNKALLFRTTHEKNNPEGRSMLRGAVIAYNFLRRIMEYEAIGVERDLAGLPVAWVPMEWLTSDDPKVKTTLAQTTKMVQDVRNNERAGLVLPKVYHSDLAGQVDHNLLFDFELLSSSGARQFDTDKIITRYNQQVAMSLLGDFVTMGHDGVGSYALGAVKMDLWVMVVDSLCKSIADEFTEHAIKRLLDINGIQYDEGPKLTYGKITATDLTALVAYVSGLANAGILTPDEGTEAWLREQGGMPPLDPDVEGIYDRAPVNPMTGLPMDPDNPVDLKTGLPVDPDTHAAPGLADATRRQAEATAEQAETAAKNPPIDPNSPDVIAAKQKPAAEKPPAKKVRKRFGWFPGRGA